MNWLLGSIVLLVIIYIWNSQIRKNKIKKLYSRLKEQWAKPKQDTFFDFERIKRYHNNYAFSENTYQKISEQTANDLDLDDLFEYIDRTKSSIGQQFLYNRIREIPNQNEDIELTELINFFDEDENFRLKIQAQLLLLNNKEGYYFETLFNNQTFPKSKYLKSAYILSFSFALFILFTFYVPILFIFLIPILALNLFIHYKNKMVVHEYLYAINQFKRTYKVAQTILNDEKIKNIANHQTFIKKLNAIEQKATFINMEKKLDNEWLILMWIPIEFLKVAFNLEYIAFYSLIGDFYRHRKSLHELFVFIGKLDLSQTISSLKAEPTTTCKPEFTLNKQMTFQEVYHPLIFDSIPNDLSLHNQSLLLTGSNMSGKTTFIRTIAINSILAQTIGICFAKKYCAPYFKIHSSIRISDDLLNNTSYYLQEVLTIKRFIDLKESTIPCLFILDEIFKGTNTQERVSGGFAILNYLNQSPHFVMVATHDLELVELLQDKNYAVYHFSEQILNDNLHFDYKIKSGKLETQNAIKILELYDYPKEITNEALFVKNTFFS